MKNKVFCKKHESPSRWRTFTREPRDVFIDFGRLFLANRCHARKSHELLPRVNPILVFAADQLSTTSTVAHCESIGSSRAARSRQQKPNLDFSAPSCRPARRFRDQFALRINISYLGSPRTIRYREIRADDIIRAGARSRNRGYEQILPHAFCRLILLCRFNDFAEWFAKSSMTITIRGKTAVSFSLCHRFDSFTSNRHS